MGRIRKTATGLAHAAVLAGFLVLGGIGDAALAQTTVYRQTQRTLTDTTSITVPYATNGRTRTWSYGWSPTGQLLSVDGPRPGSGDTTSYTYTALGYVETITSPLGHVTTATSWNGRGQPTSVVDPNGVSTTLSYDIRDRVLSVTINPGPSQSQYLFEYDAVGNLVKVTQPEGGWLRYTYDAGSRLTGIENDRGETQALIPNALGDPTAITLRTSGGSITAQQNFVYDELGRLIQAIGAGSQTTGFGYDKVDNPKSVTDARGKLWQTGFDALNRVISETNPQSQSVQLAYSPSDQVTSHKDGRLLETTRVVDGFGEVIREVSPDRGTLTYWYDEAGNLTQIVDGDGQQTNYTYDAASRLTSATFSGASAETITYSYDSVSGGNRGRGRLTGVTEESGSSTFTYDAQGRLTRDAKVIQGRSYTVEYAYDRNGGVTGLTLPSGRSVAIARAIDGRVTGITTRATPSSTPETIVANVAYRPFGPLQGLDYGNGLTLTRSYDQNYWLERIEVKASGVTRLDLSFGRNANGQLTGVTDNASSGRGASFGYTDAGRLESADGAWGNDTFTYDAAGNRSGKSRQIGGTTSQENLVLPPTSNRVTATQDASAATLRALTWRSGGDLAQAAFAGGPTYDYSYNARKRLVLVRQDGSDRARYGYDFRGLRVWRKVLLPTVRESHYVFDAEGHILAEHDGATGAVIREFIWLNDLPVALIDSSTGAPEVFFIHSGQIHEPLVMTDASKGKVWDAYVEPFGQATVFGAPSVGLPIRLPGQWEELETGGLFQNWHRNYDPSLGRYIEADPIGIGAGQNLYAYAGGDPNGTVDPDGRVAFVLLPVAGAVGGEGLAASVGLGLTVGFGVNALIAKPNHPYPRGLSRGEISAFDRYCRHSRDPCEALKNAIQARLKEAQDKMRYMLKDPRQLYKFARYHSNEKITGTSTTWWGHDLDLHGKINDLKELISLARKMGCNVNAEAAAVAALIVPLFPSSMP